MEKNTLQIVNRDTLKYIAIVPMAIGHFTGSFFGAAVNPQESALLFLLTHMALIAPPIFFFFIAEGFRYTRSRKKYALRLLIFAVITQVPFCLSENGTLLTTDFFLNLNIFFTLFLGFVALVICDSEMNTAKKIALIVLLDAATVLLGSEWMLTGIPIIISMHIFRDKPAKRLLCFTACVAVMLGVSYFSYDPLMAAVYCAADLLFLMAGYFIVTVFYNGEKGKHPVFSKYFFYAFYPLHLLVIYLAKLFWGAF